MRGMTICRLLAHSLAATAVAASAFAYAPEKRYHWPVHHVIDGDTIAVIAVGDFPPELSRISVRVAGIDTPEKGHRAKCAREQFMGNVATTLTKRLVAGADAVWFTDLKYGKWAGRVLAKVWVDGKDLGAMLLKAGLARPYNGRKKPDYCEGEPDDRPA